MTDDVKKANDDAALAFMGFVDKLSPETPGHISRDCFIDILWRSIGNLWFPAKGSSYDFEMKLHSLVDALHDAAPRNALEARLIVQMLDTYSAASECLRRAMIEGQTFEGRDQNLTHAAHLMDIYHRQLVALDEHRGKGRQKIPVGQVNIHAVIQPIAAEVNTGQAGLSPPASMSPQTEGALVDDSAASDEAKQMVCGCKAKPAKSATEGPG